MQPLVSSLSASDCLVQPQRKDSNAGVLAAEGAFAFQNGGLQSKLIEVQQPSDCWSVHQGNSRKSPFFFICRISGILTICYFSELFYILKFKIISNFFYEIYIYITLSLSKLEMKRKVDRQNVSESLNVEILNNLKLYPVHT
jgi:hypothetical protein